jgi:hypothetical protein
MACSLLRKSKRFFFEKKKQKTFVSAGFGVGDAESPHKQVFCCFLWVLVNQAGLHVVLDDGGLGEGGVGGDRHRRAIGGVDREGDAFIGHHGFDEGDFLHAQQRQLGGGNVVDVEDGAGGRCGRAVMGFNVHGQKSFQREDVFDGLLWRI